MIEGFDVSRWQSPGLWGWEALKKSSVKFMIARASYGSGFADPNFIKFAELIRGSGLVFGAYHFFRQVQSPELQMELFQRQLDKVGGLREGNLFPVLDLEDNRANGDGPAGISMSRGGRLVAERWRDKYGGVILYYSSYFPQVVTALNDWINEDGYYHWLADYSRLPGQPRHPYTKEWYIHQPKAQAVPEYAGGRVKVDYNVINPDKDFYDMTIGGNLEKDKVLGEPYMNEIELSTTAGVKRALNLLGCGRPSLLENSVRDNAYYAVVGFFQGGTVDSDGAPLNVDGDVGPKTKQAIMSALADLRK